MIRLSVLLCFVCCVNIGFQAGLEAPDFKAENVIGKFTEKSARLYQSVRQKGETVFPVLPPETLHSTTMIRTHFLGYISGPSIPFGTWSIWR
jgi:hypothetical protein